MTHTLSKLALAATLAAAPLAVSSASAAADIGLLGCHSKGSTGFVIGSKEDLVCEFTPAGSGQTELYAATLDTYGLDVGVTGRTVMTWAVASVGDGAYAPNSLSGTYVGATADASVGVGGGGSLLTGGDQSSFTLQPLSLQAQEGVNAALGVTKFTLKPAVGVPAAQVPVAIPVTPGNDVPVAPPAN